MQEGFKEFLELFESEEGAEAREPVYERGVERTFSQHWSFPLPRQIPPVGHFDLATTLRNVNLAIPSQSYVEVEALSILLTRLRAQLTTRPLLCDMDIFYLYAILLRRLSMWFYNVNLRFVSYFCEKQQQSLLFEYINVLLLSVLRLYHDATASCERWNKESGIGLGQCRMVMEELLRTSEYCLSEKFCEGVHTDKWFYKAAPTFIRSDGVKEGGETLQEDKRAMRRYIEEELCGVGQIRARVILLGTKRNEVALSLWEDFHSKETDSEERCRTVHEKIAPLLERIAGQYGTISTQLRGQKRGRLHDYAQYLSFYWFIMGEMALIESEYECFENPECERRVLLGKSALNRLESLATILDQKKRKWVSSTRLDQRLREGFTELITRADSLYDKLHTSLTSAYDYNSSLVVLEPMESLIEKEEGVKGEFTTFAREKLDLFLTSKEGEMVGHALDLLEKLYKGERSMATVMPIVVPSASSQSELTNEKKQGIVEERLRQLRCLLAMKNPDGTIVISAQLVKVLESERVAVQRASSHNTSTQ